MITLKVSKAQALKNVTEAQEHLLDAIRLLRETFDNPNIRNYIIASSDRQWLSHDTNLDDLLTQVEELKDSEGVCQDCCLATAEYRVWNGHRLCRVCYVEAGGTWTLA